MAGITIDNIKYISIMDDDNNLKFTSFNNRVYYTLRDIFWNCEDTRIMDLANELTKKLIDDIGYTNVLEDYTYLNELYNFLSRLKDSYFYFVNTTKQNNEVYIEFDIWYIQLQELRQLVSEKLIHLQ
jgi:hypothetical protein